MIYAYAICEPSAADPPARGLEGAEVRAIATGGVAAVHSEVRSARPEPSPELVLCHERVVEAVMERGPVLPLRFGTTLEDEDELAAVLVQRRDEFLGALERVRGRVEMALRVIPERPAGGSARTGSEYLRARVDQHRQAQAAAAELHPPLAELAEASTVRDRPSPPAILVASYLVDEDRVDGFRARAQQLAARRPDAHVVVTGPLPPYTFAPGDPA